MVKIPARGARKPNHVDVRPTVVMSFFCPMCGILNYISDCVIPDPLPDGPIDGNCGTCGKPVTFSFEADDPLRPSRN